MLMSFVSVILSYILITINTHLLSYKDTSNENEKLQQFKYISNLEDLMRDNY